MNMEHDFIVISSKGIISNRLKSYRNYFSRQDIIDAFNRGQASYTCIQTITYGEVNGQNIIYVKVLK